MMLPKEQGYYLNADNSPAAMVRLLAFEKWTAENGLKWAAVGLDMEPTLLNSRLSKPIGGISSSR
jgi:hypothetical protein